MKSRLVPGIVAILAAVFGLLTMRPVSSFDVWWHLSMGRAAVEAGARSFPDPVGLAAAEVYVDAEWLFDVVLFGLYRLGGIPLVNLLVAVLAATSFVLAWRVAEELCGRRAPWTALTLACLVAGSSFTRFVARPQAAYLVFLPLALFLGLRVGRSFRSSAVALVVLVAVWAQTHASVIVAPAVILGAMWTGLGSSGDSLGWRRLRLHHGLLVAVLAALTLTSAHGLGIVSVVLEHRDQDVIRHIQEMRPLRLAEMAGSRSNLFLFLLLAATALGVASRRRLPLGPAALLGLGLVLAGSSVRFLVSLSYLALPLAATSWSGRQGREARAWPLLGLAAACIVPATLAWRSGAPSLDVHASNFPVRGAEVLQELEVRGPIFNTFNDGGYLGWQLYGQIRTVIDGRTPVLFDGEEFYAARVGDDRKNVFDSLNRSHRFAAAIVPKDRQVCLDLVDDRQWSTVWTGERHTIFMPSASAPQALTRLSACSRQEHSVQRCRASADLDAFLAEVAMAQDLAPKDAYLSRLGAELALQCLPRPRLDQAVGFLQGAASLESDHPDYAWLTAFVLQARSEPEKALFVLGGVTLDHLRAQTLRLRLLMDLGHHRRAAELGRSLAERHDDHTPPRVRVLVAEACEAAGDRRCAVRNALRASLEGFEPALAVLRRYLQQGWVPEEHQTLARGALGAMDSVDRSGVDRAGRDE